MPQDEGDGLLRGSRASAARTRRRSSRVTTASATSGATVGRRRRRPPRGRSAPAGAEVVQRGVRGGDGEPAASPRRRAPWSGRRPGTPPGPRPRPRPGSRGPGRPRRRPAGSRPRKTSSRSARTASRRGRHGTVLLRPDGAPAGEGGATLPRRPHQYSTAAPGYVTPDRARMASLPGQGHGRRGSRPGRRSSGRAAAAAGAVGGEHRHRLHRQQHQHVAARRHHRVDPAVQRGQGAVQRDRAAPRGAPPRHRLQQVPRGGPAGGGEAAGQDRLPGVEHVDQPERRPTAAPRPGSRRRPAPAR